MSHADNIHELPLTDKNSACSCGGHGDKAAHGHDHATSHINLSAEAGAIIAEYLVTGMTCDHCVSSVTEELSAIDAVQTVQVELNVGGESRVAVSSATALDLDAVRGAIEEAGYELVTPAS